MPLIRLDDLQLTIGTQAVLDHVGLPLKRGEKIGLLGRNGAGKSTLLRIIAGEVKPDAGSRWVRPATRIAMLSQSLPDADDLSVFDVVAGGLEETGRLLAEYEAQLDAHDADLDRLARVQQEIDAKDGWRFRQRIDTVLTRLQLPAHTRMRELSGGWRRRVALARALVGEPDVLLLDEPTNHLDLPTILWLEEQLREFRGTLLLITHDRAFLQSVANTILELDRGHLYRWDGDYAGFLKMREERLHAEDIANTLFDKRLAEEEKWIRKGIEARRTRNEGRVRALKAMRVDRAARREQAGKAGFSLEAAERSGKLVAEALGVTQSFNGRVVIRDFSTTILRGDRIGLIGPNGAGKSTLLNILLGRLAPENGTVRLGTNLQVVYFDQLLTQLEPEKSVIDNVAEGSDVIEVGGKRKHIVGYLQDFLFAPDRIRQPVSALSGGERARVILAKLFTKPANLLVLDEPTNDLDIETLELLEEILLDFPGTLLVVSHDRAFLDNVVTGSFVFEGDGVVREYVGTHYPSAASIAPQGSGSGSSKQGASLVPVGVGLKPDLQNDVGVGLKPDLRNDVGVGLTTDLRNDVGVGLKTDLRNDVGVGLTTDLRKDVVGRASARQAEPARKKLSYKDRLELDALPALIEKTETEVAALESRIADPAFFTQSHETTEGVLRELAQKQEALQRHYARWESLEG